MVFYDLYNNLTTIITDNEGELISQKKFPHESYLIYPILKKKNDHFYLRLSRRISFYKESKKICENFEENEHLLIGNIAILQYDGDDKFSMYSNYTIGFKAKEDRRYYKEESIITQNDANVRIEIHGNPKKKNKEN